ncbi:lysozyme C II-like [Lampris incognitus]|uniref:lysozyme C II-like n=1 Tax=Lampris incognitus TaxID=2546036 RepID=UPI0024B4AF4C|nr:lysozyme C II-like [Lampris incognitus]
MRGILFLLFVAMATAKVYDQCDWARVLNNNRMDGHYDISLVKWMCLTKWKSDYNTTAITRNSSTDYGMLGRNSRHWCEDYKTPGGLNICGIQCSELLTDDVSAAIGCAKLMVLNPLSSRRREAWHRHCQN